MKNLLKDLNWKFGFLASLMIVAVTLSAQGLIMREARIGMESRLSEKATFINMFYAFLIADALHRQDDVTLQQVISRLEDDPEVTSVVVVDDKGTVRYHADAEKLGTHWDDPLIQKSLETSDGVMSPFQNSGGRALALISPLKVQGMPHPIGAVRIEMTYRHIQQQLAKFDNSFDLALLGFISAGIGLMIAFVRRWVTYPLEMTEKAVAHLHWVTAEPNLPETPDEFGRLNKTLNDMILRLKTEFQDQMGGGPADPGETEKDLADRLMQSFLPDARVIIANKDNLIISNHAEGLSAGQAGAPAGAATVHLLDLITDANFGTLVGNAFQREGEVVRGPIVFQGKPYDAAILRLAEGQSKVIKTVIALKPTNV